MPKTYKKGAVRLGEMGQQSKRHKLFVYPLLRKAFLSAITQKIGSL